MYIYSNNSFNYTILSRIFFFMFGGLPSKHKKKDTPFICVWVRAVSYKNRLKTSKDRYVFCRI